MALSNSVEWLNEPREGPFPALDRLVLMPIKVSYLAQRILLRLILGKSRRNNLRYAAKFWLDRQYSPSFHLMRWLYRTFGMSVNKDGTHLLKIHVPKQDYDYLCRIERGDFTPGREDDIANLFTPKKGDVVVDIGAHIGRYTITSSKRVGPTGKVIAIEAAPDNFDMLNRNVQLNRLDNVVLLNCAAYSTQTTLKLYEPSADGSIYNTIMPCRAGHNGNYVKVNASTLDSILDANGLRKVDWIKIDVEGAEFEVLKGSVNTLANNKDLALLIEVHDILDNNHYSNIANFLDSYGYKVHQEHVYFSERHVVFKGGMA